MKYIVIEGKNGDLFTKEFATEAEALEAAERDWNALSDYDKEHCDEFTVIESANPDEDAPDHLDGNVIKEFI